MIAERAPGARQQLAQVVAGDVLDHPAARLERLAAARNRDHAEHMVARRPGPDAPRPAICWPQPRRRWCRGPRFGRAAGRSPSARRPASWPLTASSASISASGVPACADSTSSSRLVKRDAGETGQVERRIGLRRTADHALRAMADDLQRLAVAERPLHRRFDVLAVAGLETIGMASIGESGGDQNRGMSANGKRAAAAHACGPVRRSGAASETPCRD